LRREGWSCDSNSGSETSAALQKVLTSSREHLAPGGAEMLNVIHWPTVLNISEGGSPVPDESGEKYIINSNFFIHEFRFVDIL
jgi:hypothetical protein